VKISNCFEHFSKKQQKKYSDLASGLGHSFGWVTDLEGVNLIEKIGVQQSMLKYAII